jgi:hypothetical protein
MLWHGMLEVMTSYNMHNKIKPKTARPCLTATSKSTETEQ